MGECDLCGRVRELVPLYCTEVDPTQVDARVCRRCKFRSIYGYYPEDEVRVLAAQEEAWGRMADNFDDAPYWTSGKKVA